MDVLKYNRKQYERDRDRINRRLREIGLMRAWYLKDRHWTLFQQCESTARALRLHNKFLRELAEVNEEANNLNALDEVAPSPETVKASATPEAVDSIDEDLHQAIDAFALAANPDRATESDSTPDTSPGQQWLDEFHRGTPDE